MRPATTNRTSSRVALAPVAPANTMFWAIPRVEAAFVSVIGAVMSSTEHGPLQQRPVPRERPLIRALASPDEHVTGKIVADDEWSADEQLRIGALANPARQGSI